MGASRRLGMRTLFVTLITMMTVIVMSGVFIYADSSITYIERSWDKSEAKVVETEKTLSSIEYSTVTSNITTMRDYTYYVSGNVTISSRLTIEGNVNLILGDGLTLT